LAEVAEVARGTLALEICEDKGLDVVDFDELRGGRACGVVKAG